MSIAINYKMEYVKSHIAEALIWLLVLIAPSYTTMAALMVIVIADFITGIWASINRGDAIQSNAMKRTVTKLILYYIAIISGLACQNLIPVVPFAQIAVGFIAMVELKSVYENIGGITGVDIWTQVREYLDRKSKK